MNNLNKYLPKGHKVKSVEKEPGLIYLIANRIGIESNYSIMMEDEFGMIITIDPFGSSRKYVICRCMLGCELVWAVRIDHLVNETLRDSRDGKGGTKCPHCFPIIYNILNEQQGNIGTVYFMTLEAEGLPYNKVGETFDWSKRWSKDEKNILQIKEKSFYESKHYKTIELRIHKYLKDEGINKGKDALPEILQVIQGTTEMFPASNGFDEKKFQELCKQIDLECEDFQTFEDVKNRWDEDFYIKYKNKKVNSVYGIKTMGSLYEKDKIAYDFKKMRKSNLVDGLEPYGDFTLKSFFYK
tara:strand:- start:257 stop:1150 length:894 start_codon:yes stop_codon:yes gene_type:complete